MDLEKPGLVAPLGEFTIDPGELPGAFKQVAQTGGLKVQPLLQDEGITCELRHGG